MATRVEDVPAELVVDFDIGDDRFAEGVHERLAEIQRTTPIAYCPAQGGYWLVTAYDDVHEVIRNDDVFSAAETGLTPGVEAPRLPPLHYDPPEHTAYRTLLNPVFSPGRMHAIEDDIRTTARALLDDVAPRGACEFVSEFAHPLTTSTFLALMGWPKDDLPQLADWTERLIVGTNGLTADELAADRTQVGAEVRAYFSRMVDERRRHPDVDDVTGYLLRAQLDEGRSLTDDELSRMLSLLMAGGLHSVRGVMASGMIHLSEHPDDRARVIAEPELLPVAVEELLRLGVGTAPARLVVAPVEMHGVTLQPGDHVVSFLSAANRDPSVFGCPNELQLDRPHNRHLTFATGRHRCLGASLARVELTIAFEEVLRRIPDFAIHPTMPPTLHHSQIRGVRALHLQFTPSA